MTVTALLSTAPVIEDSMAPDVARAVEALEAFDVTYEVGPMGTTIEARDTETLFAAARAAHDAVEADRVSTLLKVDDDRVDGRDPAAKVAAVEEHLGRSATSDS